MAVEVKNCFEILKGTVKAEKQRVLAEHEWLQEVMERLQSSSSSSSDKSDFSSSSSGDSSDGSSSDSDDGLPATPVSATPVAPELPVAPATLAVEPSVLSYFNLRPRDAELFGDFLHQEYVETPADLVALIQADWQPDVDVISGLHAGAKRRILQVVALLKQKIPAVKAKMEPEFVPVKLEPPTTKSSRVKQDFSDVTTSIFLPLRPRDPRVTVSILIQKPFVPNPGPDPLGRFTIAILIQKPFVPTPGRILHVYNIDLPLDYRLLPEFCPRTDWRFRLCQFSIKWARIWD